MARAKKAAKAAVGAPAWMVTFADLMTLLLTFFVLLLSMSTLDNQRIKVALGSLRGSVGVLTGGGMPREGRNEMANMKRLAQGPAKLMTNLERVVDRQNDRNVSKDFIQIGHKDQSVFLTIDDSLLFGPGSTDVLPTAYGFLDDIASVLGESRATVEFIGHSDPTPPAGFYENNWEVGAARALSVMQYVADTGDLEGQRLKVSSHGPFLPRAANDTPEGRARNRRVELVMTLTTASDRYFYGEDRLIRHIDAAPTGPAFSPKETP